MRHRSTILPILTLAATMGFVAPAPAIDYWPDDPDGLVYRYRYSGGGSERAVSFEVDGEFHIMSGSHGDCSHGIRFLPGADTLSLEHWWTICEGMPDPDYDIYDPPVEIVRPGMADGDAWLWEGSSVWYDPALVLVMVSAETVTVPLGTYDTLKVTCQPLMGNAPWPSRMWLHAELGPVRLHSWELEAIDGAVIAESRSWSEVKSLFR